MYDQHQAKISQYGRQGPAEFKRVLYFVVLTIRARLFNIPADMDMLENPPSQAELNGLLYGHKAGAILHIDAEAAALYWQAEEIVYHARNDREAAEDLIALFATIPGIGMVKAGFMAQLLYGVGACLDSHNIARYGIPAARIKSDRLKKARRLATRQAIIAEYCDYVDLLGGTRALWNTWCEYVATRPDETGVKMNGNRPLYRDAYHVSALHCEALGIAA